MLLVKLFRQQVQIMCKTSGLCIWHLARQFDMQPENLCTHWPTCRPFNTHGVTVRLTVSAVISQSHGGGPFLVVLLSVNTIDVPSHTTGGFNRFSEC